MAATCSTLHLRAKIAYLTSWQRGPLAGEGEASISIAIAPHTVQIPEVLMSDSLLQLFSSSKEIELDNLFLRTLPQRWLNVDNPQMISLHVVF